MRKILIFIFSLLILGCAPKITNSDIKSDLTTYLNFVQNGDYEKAISYMPTDFWKFYKKEEYLNGLNEITNETGYISADNPEIQEVGELKKIENNYFKVINYKINLNFDSSKVPNKIIEEYRSHYGGNSVEIDTDKNLIKIKNENAMIAVFDKKVQDWRFLELDSHIITKMYSYQTWLECIKTLA